MLKKTILLCLALLLICSGVFATENTLNDKSQVEQVMLKKGSLIMKEFYDCSKTNSISGNILVLTDVISGTVTAGFRLSHSYYNSKYDSGESTGILDAKEIDSVLSTLDFLKKKLPTFTLKTPYTEIIYKSNGGMEIGAFHSEGKQKLFIKFDYKDTAFYDAKVIPDFIDFFNYAKNKMTELDVFK